MVLTVFNTMTRKKEVFKPMVGKKVKMYTCGLTVYDYPHVGHSRVYMVWDLLHRYLEYSGYELKHVQNITDIHDSIIKRAKESNRSLEELTEEFTNIAFEDLDKLRIKRAHVYPKVTDHVPEIIDMIKILIDKGYAYKADDGSVYYDISKFKDYGKLSRLKMDGTKAGARVAVDDYKENPQDFALWKAASDAPVWDSPWGKGRPGWHIECSVMAKAHLGDTLDIHTGGMDHYFPHHENEIAQSEAANGKKFVNYWMHTAFLNIGGEKMSKSLNNFIKIRDILKTYTPEELRFFMISAHYRSPIDYNPDNIEYAKNGLIKIYTFLDNLEFYKKSADAKGKSDADVVKLINKSKADFVSAMDDDLNTPIAVESYFTFIKAINKIMVDEGAIGSLVIDKIKAHLYDMDEIFSILPDKELKIIESILYDSNLLNDLIDIHQTQNNKLNNINAIDKIYSEFKMIMDNFKSDRLNKDDFDKEKELKINLIIYLEKIKNVISENKSKINSFQAEMLKDNIDVFDKLIKIYKIRFEELLTSEQVNVLINERESARMAKDFKKSDEIRDKLDVMGIVIEDTKDGVRWKKKR